MKLFKQNGSVVWWVSHGTGKDRIRKTTGESDYDKAIAKAEQICAAAKMRDDADWIESLVSTAELKRKRATAMEFDSISLAECLKRYPPMTANKNTLQGMFHTWKTFVEFFHARGIKTIGEVTTELVQDLIRSQKPAWGKAILVYSKGLFRRMGVKPSPLDDVSTKRRTTTHHEPMSIEQVTVLLKEAGRYADTHHYDPVSTEYPVYLRFLLYTGLRMGDAATFENSGLDREKGELIRKMDKARGKIVRFPAHPDLLKLLPASDDRYLFPATAKLYLSRSTALSARIKRLLIRTGIIGEPNQFCAHAFRTTFASICAQNSIPMPVIQSWLGHSSMSITRIYARIEDMESKKKAIERFPSLG